MNFSDFFEALGVAAFGTKTGEPINCGAGLELEDSVSGGADDSYMAVSYTHLTLPTNREV